NYDQITQPAECVLEPLIRLSPSSRLMLLREHLYLLTLNKLHPLFFEHNKKNGDQSQYKNPELNLPERLLQPACVVIVSRKLPPSILQQIFIRGLRREHPLKIFQRADDGKNSQVAFLDDLGEHWIFNRRRLLFQCRNLISEPATAFNHDNRPVPPNTLQQLVFGNGTAID